VVVSDQRFHRAAEHTPLCGSIEKIRLAVGWKPRRTFEEMIEEMVTSDLAIEAGNLEARRS